MSLRKPSHFFDGLQDNWYNFEIHCKTFEVEFLKIFFFRFHFTCFWKKIKQSDINEASIRGIELLKWSDQERIRKKINESQGLILNIFFSVKPSRKVWNITFNC